MNQKNNSFGFASGTHRIWDTRKGAISNKFI